MSARVEAAWGHDQRAVIKTVGDLDALLDRIDAEARRLGLPQDVQLTDPRGGGTLGIVVGAERSVLNHIPDDSNPPYLTSVGDEDEDQPFTFYVAGDHHSEAHWRHTVRTDVARAAARTFVLSGRLDERIPWEEV